MKILGNPFSSPTNLKDPFSKSNVSEFHIHGYPPRREGEEWRVRATLEFENGDTSGTQSFRGASLEETLKKMDVFIKNLK